MGKTGTMLVHPTWGGNGFSTRHLLAQKWDSEIERVGVGKERGGVRNWACGQVGPDHGKVGWLWRGEAEEYLLPTRQPLPYASEATVSEANKGGV